MTNASGQNILILTNDAGMGPVSYTHLGGVEVLVNPGAVGAANAPGGVAPVVLTELRQGQVVGEVALVDQGVRSATIRVSRDETLLLRLRRDQLMRLCETYPVLGYKLMRNLASELATKIRNTDWLVRQYQLRLQSEADNG